MNLRVLCYNIHRGVGWKKIQTTQHIQSKIVENYSDIVFLQETSRNQSEQLKSEIYPYHVYANNVSRKKCYHGNAILSKFPIIFSHHMDISMHRFENRCLLHSIIECERKKPIHLLCTHLGLIARHRGKQLDMIVKYIIDHIPDNDPIILAGDFNDWAGYATIPLIHNLALEEAFLNAHRAYARTFPSWRPVLKLDRVYFRGFNVNYAQRLTHKLWRHLSDHIAIEVSLDLVLTQAA